jgi:hypothetical protein
MLTMEEMQAKYGQSMHPEYAKRLFAWLEAQGGNIGIGSGWRPTPDDASQASMDGKSFHQDQEFASGYVGCSAVDLVARNAGGVHRAPYWDEVPKQGTGHPDTLTFGVHCNVEGEPWHMQCWEMDGWQSWINAGSQDPGNHQIPGGGTPPPVTTPPPTSPPVGDYGLFPLDQNKPTIRKGDTNATSGSKVGYLQAVLKDECGLSLAVDGHFGSDTENKLKTMQGWNGLEKDGICGPKTWAVVDTYATD